jgi:glycosyltransferase involved in cell wall biosynthesis
VIICAHTLKRLDLTLTCIGSVLSGSLVPTEMVVVVDRNPELHEKLACRTAGMGVTVLTNDGQGAADARSTGARHCTGEFLAFIDDDAWAEPTWLENLVDHVASARAIGAGGLILPDWQPGASRLAPELLWLVGCTYKGHPVEEGPISRPIGANMGVRRLELLEVGGFPSNFGPRDGRKSSSNEELAFFTALRERFGDACVLYVPSAVVHHSVPAERTTWQYAVERSWAEGTSKAEAVNIFGPRTMTHDTNYVVRTLLPGAARYCVEATKGRALVNLRNAAMCITSLAVTGAAYGWRSLLVRWLRRPGLSQRPAT